MGLHKIIKIVAAAVSVLGIIFLIMIISKGDDAIAAEAGLSAVDYMSYAAYFVLAIVLIFVLGFVLKNMFSNKETLMITVKGVGAFLVLGLICYFVFAEGIEKPMADGETLSASGDKLIGAGLYMFYALTIIATGAMVYTGVKKMIK